MTGTERCSSLRTAARWSLEASNLNGAAIDRVIDRRAFNAELDEEKRDAAFLDGVRTRVHDVLEEYTYDGRGE